ncbi:MAG: ThiF family adenylyltransferase [Mariniblastus sp.]|nr:ThiF family adenylyltransferase [Mariniblastus sp.]
MNIERCNLSDEVFAGAACPEQVALSGCEATGSPDLLINDDDRYSRLRLIGWWEQEKIAAAKVLVVGAGALGNEVLKNLVLMGIGEITLVDFDTVQCSNLSRSVLFRSGDAGQPKAVVAARVAQELNPDCKIKAVQGDVLTEIGLGFVREQDVVISCVDNREARLWINRMCWKVATPWIDGGIQEINGVAKVFRPGEGPCYECGMTEKDYQLIQLRYSCPLLKQEDVLQGRVPTAPTIASMIGGLQVQEALKLIHDMPTEGGTALVYNGVANRFYSTRYPWREDCLSHESYEPIIRSPLSAQTSTLSDLFGFVDLLGVGRAEQLELDRDLVEQLECRLCGHQVPVGQPRSDVPMKRAICERCEQPMAITMTHQIDRAAASSRKLCQVGIPAYDIVKVRTDSGIQFIQLSGDAP